MSIPPFSEDQIKSINEFQNSEVMHPFTCCDHQSMVAEKDGMRCLKCNRLQEWVHEWMANWEWKTC